MKQGFRPKRNIGVNSRNSYLKLNPSLRKTRPGKTVCLKFPEVLKRTLNFNAFKYKVKYYYLSDLSNLNF